MNFRNSYVVPLRFVVLIWIIFFIDLIVPFEFVSLGIYPRHFTGLTGILFAPLLHGSLLHLLSNTFPLFFLGFILYIFYDHIANKVFFQGYFFTGLLVWIFGRSFIHIGASGLIYCIASFLIFFGIFRKDPGSIIISILIIFIYGGLIYGLFPNQPGVSWESHLYGGIVGLILASRYSNIMRVKG